MWYEIRLNFQINTLLRALFFQKWGLFSHPARLEAALSYADVQLPIEFNYRWRPRVQIGHIRKNKYDQDFFDRSSIWTNASRTCEDFPCEQ